MVIAPLGLSVGLKISIISSLVVSVLLGEAGVGVGIGVVEVGVGVGVSGIIHLVPGYGGGGGPSPVHGTPSSLSLHPTNNMVANTNVSIPAIILFISSSSNLPPG